MEMSKLHGYIGIFHIFLTIILFSAPSFQLKDYSAFSGLFLSNSTHILFRPSPSSEDQTVVFEQPHGRIVALAVDIRHGHVFWSDVSHVFRGIYSADLIGPGRVANVRRILYNDVSEVNGLTVDWASRHLYWTDATKRSIEVSNYEGTGRAHLAIEGLVTPRSILADPVNGFLYWGDQGSRMIERSRLDGSDRQVMAKEGVFWPNQLALMDNKLFWVDAWSKSVEQVDLSNNSVSRVMSLSRETNDNPLFGLTTRGALLYATVWNTGVVMEIDVSSKTSRTLQSDLGTDAMFDAQYVDYIKQEEVLHPCGDNKGGCSHLCLPTEGAKYRCTCPTFGGKSLAADGRTCRDPENVLFYAISDQGQGQVGFIDLDGAPSVERTLVAKSLRPVAVGYDPTKQQVYWSDVHERTVHRAFLNGTGHEIFLNHNHSLGVVDGLYVDWKHGNLYYSNMGHVNVERAAFYWHKIEMITLDGSTRRTVVTLVDKPRAIAVDMDAGYLYYSDWGENAKVIRCDLDGSDPVLVQDNLENPNGITLYGGNIHVVDSHAKSKESGNEAQTGSLYSSATSGEQWKEAEGLQLGIPFGIARYKNKIFISDWEKKGIFETSIDNQGKLQNLSTVLDGIDSPMGLFYSKRVENEEPTSDVCESSTRCEEVCIVSPSGAERCSCDSYTPETLAVDNSTCRIPKNFVIISDMNSIKLRGLQSVNYEMSVLVRGNSYFSNFAALVYDATRKTVYFSDVNRKTIFSSSIDGKEIKVFHQADDVIDGMALDLTNQRLFWTEYNSGSIVSKDLIGSFVRNHMIGLSKPRAIQVDGKRGMLYWTEWGKPPKVGQYDLNKNMTLTLLEAEVREPNGLHLDLDNQVLYVGDAGKRTVFKCQLSNVSACHELTFIRNLPLHIFDLKVKDDWVIYSNWLEHSIMGVSMTTGQQEVLVRGLMRPTVFVIENDSGRDCPSISGCSDLCVTLLGNFLCMCRRGRRLASDGKTCMNDVPWLPADDFLCQDGCPSNSTCSRYQATVKFSCECLPGYTPTNEGPEATCMKCSKNHFKAEIGPKGCTACPQGSHSLEGATSCECEDGLTWDWQRKVCSGLKPGDCPSSRSSVVPCTSPCNSDTSCHGAKKCCRADGCPGMQCVDPVGLEHCVYDGQVYSVGQYFSPDNCTRCQCSSIKPSRTNEYGQAICSKTKCPVLECSAGNQVHPTGQCCPLCLTDTEAPLMIEGCPTEVVTLVLPSDEAYVEYSPTVKIVDNRRINRDIQVSKFPQMTLFWWSGKGQNASQKIEVKAEAQAPDGSMDNGECDLVVHVKDETPPQITCPKNITTYTKDGSTAVPWPSPSANDNVGLSSKPRLNGPIRDQFTTGRHEVSYYVTDLSSNGAQCSFFIDVRLLDTRCPVPPTPQHGKLDCVDFRNHTQKQLKLEAQCKLTCQEGYMLNTNMNIHKAYTCNHDGDWKPDFPEGFVNFACIKMRTLRWWLHGSFEVIPHLGSVSKERDIDAGVKHLFEQKYFRLLDFIPSVNLNVTRHRRSRLRQFIITFEIEGVQNATDISYHEQLTQLLQQMNQDAENGRLLVRSNGQTLHGRQVSLKNISLRCAENEQRLSNTCLLCPVGTYFDDEEKKCVICPQGYYQGLEGQRSCLECPQGTTSKKGAFSEQLCRAEVSVHTASTKVPKEVIAGAVVGSLVFIIGVIIIVIVVIAIRRHLNDSKVNYIINSRDHRQMEFANRAYDDQNNDVAAKNKTNNGRHTNGYHGDKGNRVTLNNGSDAKHNGSLKTDSSVSQDGGNGVVPLGSESVLL